MYDTLIEPAFIGGEPLQHLPADRFPTIHPVHWLHSHFAVGGWSPLRRLSGMLTAHMTRIAPRNGFTWHPHRGLEIYTWVLEGTLYHEDSTGGSGTIGPGELQRMFSGDHILHQELNLQDEPVRVIQIWYVAGLEHIGLPPHYQQVERDRLPVRSQGDARVFDLIGEASPMEQHMAGRLTAATVPAGGQTQIVSPEDGESLFLYVTDGRGALNINGGIPLDQYDVILATPEAESPSLQSSADGSLQFLSFYLPEFLSTN